MSGNKYFWIFFLILISILLPSLIYAQSSAAVLNRRAELESQLKRYEEQIAELDKTILDTKRNEFSLERDISILTNQIAKARLDIKVRNLAIKKISTGITAREDLIGDLLLKIEREKASLSDLLRKQYEMTTTSLAFVILGHDRLSEFFNSIDTLDEVQSGIQQSFIEIRSTKVDTEGEIDTLERRRADQLELRTLQRLEEKRLHQRENEKDKLLKETRGEEARYRALRKVREKSASEIRSELFVLRGSDAIPFERAVVLATKAEKKIGIRAAFLLGIIAEESNLGQNVGTGNWRKDLSHPRCKRQKDAFIKITDELGINPDVVPVSRRAWYGYCGGAMGPAQFIPTTWLLFKGSVSKVTGHNPPNPWDPEDAFMASALLLRDNGAGAGGEAAERRAALRYLAGGNWRKPSYAFYGDDVMDLASKYQRQIDILNQ